MMTSDELYNLLQTASNPYHINIDAFNIHNLPQNKFNQLVLELLKEGKIGSFIEYDNNIPFTYYRLNR